jgi:hypothetical protein
MVNHLRDPERPLSEDTSNNATSDLKDLEKEAGTNLEDGPVRWMTPRIVAMGIIVSIGGMIFGYDTGNAIS